MSDEYNDADSVNEDVEAVLPEYRRIFSEDDGSASSAEETRAAAIKTHKALLRAAFLTNELATEEDFERLWPRLLDDYLVEHAYEVFTQAMEALQDELSEPDKDDE